MSNGIENLGGLNIPLAVCLFVAWLIVFGALSKGVQSLGKISYFTATFPYVMLTQRRVLHSGRDGSGEATLQQDL